MSNCLSPEWPTKIDYAGKVWPSAEHLYQALKYEETDPVYMELIRKARTAKDAAELGKRGRFPRPGWQHDRFNMMFIACEAKFKQHDRIRRSLLNTKEFDIEISYSDFWNDNIHSVLETLKDQLSVIPFDQLSLIDEN